jgi:hypothetical protein
MIWPEGLPLEFRVTRVLEGPEYEAVIRATDQHPFPGKVIYRLARRHVRAAGICYRLAPSP